MGQGILATVRTAEGMEGFKAHVQIVEDDGIVGWDNFV